MIDGVVVVLTDKGFGFLACDGVQGLEEVFFHARVVQGSTFEELRLGQRVRFLFGRARDGKGPRARKLVALTGEDQALFDKWAATQAGQSKGASA